VGVENADLETSSTDYARRFAGPVGEWFLAVQTRATLELLAPWPRARVLDLGGGHGQIAGPLLAAGHEVTIYGSEGACGEAVQAWARRGEVVFRSGDPLLHRLPGGRG
jgi:hypothetical protein